MFFLASLVLASSAWAEPFSIEGNQDPRLAIEGCRSAGLNEYVPIPIISSPSHPQIVRGKTVFLSDDFPTIELRAEPQKGIYQQWAIINSAAPSTERWVSQGELTTAFKPERYGVYTVVLGGKSKQGTCGYVGFQFAVLNSEAPLAPSEMLDWRAQYHSFSKLTEEFPFLKKISTPERVGSFTGRKIRIAVLDSGINMNTPDLRHAIARNADGTITGRNYIHLGMTPNDELGHGTFVAGILAGAMSGIAPDRIEILSIKTMSPLGMTDESKILSGIVDAVGLRADIIYLNGSCEKNCPQMEKSLQKLLDRYLLPQGILLVTGAGDVRPNPNKPNERDNDIVKIYPGSIKSQALLTVTGLDEKNNLAETACFGATSTHMAAPAKAQSTCNYLSNTGETQYCVKSDTSIAAAQVAAAIALLMSESPGLNAISAAERVMNSGDQNSSLVGKTISGNTLNVKRALLFKK